MDFYSMEGQTGSEESLYIHCLFKTISFSNLKDELQKRSYDTSSESYYIMTLKLRLDILKKASCNEALQEEVKNEIEGLKQKIVVGYVCSIVGCKYRTRNYDFLLSHLRSLHASGDNKVICQLNGCDRVLSSVKMLQIHIRANHRTRKSTVLIKQNQLVEILTRLKCLSASCGHQQSKTVKDLKLHLSTIHTDNGEEVNCIFAGCKFQTQKTGTLRSHFSRKHPCQQINDLKADILVHSDRIEDPEVTPEFHLDCQEHDSDVIEPTEDMGFNESASETIEFEDEEEADGRTQEVFTRALAMQFNCWMNIQNIAYSTVNVIVSEVFNSFHQGVTVTKEKVREHLVHDGWEHAKVEDLLSKIDLEDPFAEAREHLENEKTRKTYISEQFEYAKPVTVRLNKTSPHEKPETMQYIPIKESLKILIEDETFIKQKSEDPYYHEPNVIKDVMDGLNFRRNKFFSENPTAVPLILFQDELEVTNPLGAGKSKHKIQCTYWTTTDIIPAFRCKVKSTQLCSLVLSRYWKKHGNDACNRNLVNDLKELENVGVEINKPSKKIIKAGLCLIVGDNLGQHQLGKGLKMLY